MQRGDTDYELMIPEEFAAGRMEWLQAAEFSDGQQIICDNMCVHL